MKKKLILVIIFLISFIAVTYLTLTNKLNTFDDIIYNVLINHRSTFLDNYFKTLTKLSNSITIVIVMSIFMIILNKKNRIKLFTILFSTAGLNKILKRIIKRARPSHIRLIVEKGFSFPSGHAMGSMSLYGFLLYLVYKYVKNKYLKIILIIVLSYLIITIGISRIYLGIHYPSDILAGYLLSLMILLLSNLIIDSFFTKSDN